MSGPRSAGRRALGARGETLAAAYLEQRGYRVLERNYRCQLGELDLIVADDAYVVFVEVKARQGQAALHPSLSVTRRKQAKVRQLGEHYLSQHPALTLQPRFDVVAITVDGGTETIEHLPNAF